MVRMVQSANKIVKLQKNLMVQYHLSRLLKSRSSLQAVGSLKWMTVRMEIT